MLSTHGVNVKYIGHDHFNSIASRFDQDDENISHWDALIVAAALHQGCETLLSEDLQHGQIIEGVRVVNPFRAAK